MGPSGGDAAQWANIVTDLQRLVAQSTQVFVHALSIEKPPGLWGQEPGGFGVAVDQLSSVSASTSMLVVGTHRAHTVSVDV